MIDDGRILCCGVAIFTRQEIASDHLNAGTVGAPAREGFNLGDVTGRPNETAQLAKAATSRFSTNLEPINPLAPVTRIGSSCPTMEISCSIPLRSLG